MSINKFGLSENISKSGDRKQYIDSIFINLTKRLEEKVDKNITYPLHMKGNKISSSFVPNTPDALINKLYLDKHLNKIDENFEKKLDRTKGEMLSDLDMGGYKIVGLSNPVAEDEGCNKRYVDGLVNSIFLEPKITNLSKNIMIKNSSGYIPILNSNLDNKYGFKVTTNSERPESKQAFNAFTYKKSEWITNGVNQNFWIQIQCPEKIKIWKFSLRGKDSGQDNIYKWTLQGRDTNEFTTWDNIYIADNDPINNIIRYFNVTPRKDYFIYRIFVHEATGQNPGLSNWQLFTLDSVAVL